METENLPGPIAHLTNINFMRPDEVPFACATVSSKAKKFDVQGLLIEALKNPIH